MEFDADRFWRLRDGLRDLRVRGQVREQAMDFRVSTRDGFRATRPLARAEDAPLRVLALGDSCTFGLGVDDDATWPAQLEALLVEAGLPVAVINGGVPGYTAFQGLRLLAHEGPALEPTLVIASFGFNDRDLWATRSDLEVARRLALAEAASPLRRSRLFVGLERALAALRRPAAGREPTADAAPRRPRLNPREFETVLADIVRETRLLGAEPIFLVWPYRFQVRQQIREPVHYQRHLLAVAAREQVPVVDPLPAFLAAGDSAFLDHVHASALGNRLAAAALRDTVVRELRRRRGADGA
jgi:lysophospholipase L1-like esterase